MLKYLGFSNITFNAAQLHILLYLAALCLLEVLRRVTNAVASLPLLTLPPLTLPPLKLQAGLL